MGFLAVSYCLNAQVNFRQIPISEDYLEPHGITMEIIEEQGEPIAKMTKNSNSEGGVSFFRTLMLKGLDNFHDGTIEMKLKSQIAPDAPELARGFIGVMFRANDDYTQYENFYLRPQNGMVDDMLRRNHGVQYATVDHDFAVFRETNPAKYENYADIALDEWIQVRIEVKGKKAALYLNNSSYATLVVDDLMMGAEAVGRVGLSVGVDLGTIGYVKDIRVAQDEPVAVPLNVSAIEAIAVSATDEMLEGEKVLKVVKNESLGHFDAPSFVKLKGIDFQNGGIEVKVKSGFLPGASIQTGNVGIAFRVAANNEAFECFYVRPQNGRYNQSQIQRNRALQYFSYPDFPFSRLREEALEVYESSADIALDEWITLRIEVEGGMARLYVNNAPRPSLLVNDLKLGANIQGGVALWVEDGAEAYFKDLKLIKK